MKKMTALISIVLSLSAFSVASYAATVNKKEAKQTQQYADQHQQEFMNEQGPGYGHNR